MSDYCFTIKMANLEAPRMLLFFKEHSKLEALAYTKRMLSKLFCLQYLHLVEMDDDIYHGVSNGVKFCEVKITTV